MDKFAEFLQENQFVPLKTDLFEKDKLVVTPYYVNPFGEIGYKDNGGFRYMDINIPNKDGYKRVKININGKSIMKFVHRMVAQTFIPNPTNLPCVNHKNRDISDNSASNLEWVTVLQNAQHEKKTRNLRKTTVSYPILQIEVLDGNYCRLVGEYNSRKEIPKYTKGFEKPMDKQYVIACCRKFRHKKSYRNYLWIFAKDLEEFKSKSGLAFIEK